MNILMIIFVATVIGWVITFGYAYVNSEITHKKKRVQLSKWLCLACSLLITCSLGWATFASYVLWDDFEETSYKITYQEETSARTQVVLKDTDGKYFIKVNNDWNMFEPERKVYLNEELLLEYLAVTDEITNLIIH